MNKKVKTITIIFLLISCLVRGQNTSYQNLDTIVTDFIKELQFINVDTICIYKDYYVGGLIVGDSCNHHSIYIPTYIFWIKQDKTFLTKKDNCFDYSTIEIATPSFWNIFFANKDNIKKEKVKIFEYIVHDKGEEAIFMMTVDHSQRQSFKMIINKDITEMNFDNFDFQKQVEKEININYKHNKSLKSKKVIAKLNQIVQNIEKRRLLIRNRR